MHPERKRMRLECWDYNTPGLYFLTFCTFGKRLVLSHIVGRDILDASTVQLTNYGRCVDEALKTLVQSNSRWKLHQYVIMPNHVHLLLELRNVKTGGKGTSGMSCPTGAAEKGVLRISRPTEAAIPRFISSVKRYTNRTCDAQLWQDGFYDHVIRDENDFLRIWKYIDENPAKWMDDTFYPKEEKRNEQQT